MHTVHKNGEDAKKVLSDDEIRDAFSKLGLDDPNVLRYLQGLQTLGTAPRQKQYWYGADSGTTATTPGVDHAKLERDS